MPEKINKTASKAKTLNICLLEPNWKWIHDDLILSRKNDSFDDSKFKSTLVVLILSIVSFAFFQQASVWKPYQEAFWWLLLHKFRIQKNYTSCYLLTTNKVNCKSVTKIAIVGHLNSISN